jgi:ribosomal protein S18 acetylase RimI-like enzyme
VERIIRLDPRHIPLLADIDFESEHQGDRAGGVSRHEMLREIERRFSKHHERFFGYRDEKGILGYVTLKPFFPGHRHCEVYWLAVRKSAQGRGIGKKLMRFIERYAKGLGFRRVCLYTGKDMTRTREFYEHIGYTKVNEFPRYYGYASGNTTAILYEKDL